jgi:hypothetical protein
VTCLGSGFEPQGAHNRESLAPRSIRAQVSDHMADGQRVILRTQPRIERSCKWPVRGSSSGEPNLRVGRVVEGKLELGDRDRHGGLTESDLTDV